MYMYMYMYMYSVHLTGGGEAYPTFLLLPESVTEEGNGGGGGGVVGEYGLRDFSCSSS